MPFELAVNVHITAMRVRQMRLTFHLVKYILSVVISSVKATFNIFSSCDYFVPQWTIKGDTAWYGLQGSQSKKASAAR